MNPQIIYEHVFTDCVEHKPGTNEYVYKFPEHWNSYNGSKEIGLRSITVKNASRDLRLQHMFFKSDRPLYVNIGFNISLSTNETMSEANEKFKKAVKTKYIEYKDEIENIRLETPSTPNHFGINDYSIEYLHSTNEFWIKILKNDEQHPCYLYFTDDDTYMSEDLKQILNADDTLFSKIAKMQAGSITRAQFDSYISEHPNVIIRYDSDSNDETKITAIGFKNVWNRETLFIASSLSTLSEDKYLTLSNVVHNPLKWYDITGYATTFSLFLYDAAKRNSVEIPNDRKDLILIEILMCAY